MLAANKIRSHFRTHFLNKVCIQNWSGIDRHLAKADSIKICATPFDKLKKAFLSQLISDEPNKGIGKYIMVRCIEKGGYTGQAWYTIVEDEKGSVFQLCIFFYSPEEMFPPGTVIIIKEPNLSKFNIGKKSDGRTPTMYSVQCNGVTDILVLRPSHPQYYLTYGVQWNNATGLNSLEDLMKLANSFTASQWKTHGDCFLKNKKKEERIFAVEAFWMGLQCCAAEAVHLQQEIKLNLLALYVEMKYYEKAIEVGQQLIRSFPKGGRPTLAPELLRKAYLCLGNVFYTIKRFDKNYHLLKELLFIFPNDKEILEEEKKVRQRLDEMVNGNFDLVSLEEQANQPEPVKIDCSDYLGLTRPCNLSRGGKGLRVMKDVKKGELLFVSEAISFVLHAPTTDITVNVIREYRPKIVLQLIELISKNPSIYGPVVFDLPHHLDRTKANEVTQMFCSSGSELEPICDVKRIIKIYDNNVFQISHFKNKKQIGAGLFIQPSYLNHNCRQNVELSFYNNVMFARAATDLKANSELFIDTVSHVTDREERKKILERRAIKCECRKCNF